MTSGHDGSGRVGAAMRQTDIDMYWGRIAPILRRAAGFEWPLHETATWFDDRTETVCGLETESVVSFVLELERETSGQSRGDRLGGASSERTTTGGELTVDDCLDLLASSGLASRADLASLGPSSAGRQSGCVQQWARAQVAAGRLAVDTERAGAVFGDYLLLDEIGSGGMGRVYRAIHLCMDRVVAVKILRTGTLDAERSMQRFRREIRATSRLRHPNIVLAHDARISGDVGYLAMEYVDGCDLAHCVRRHHPLTVRLALDYILQAARGLEHAHQHQIVHRDVKPSNLLLGSQGIVKVTDLGLARFRRLGGAELSDEDDVTGDGAALGTYSFMSPEQSRDAQRVDQRTDIYSLGCTLFFLLVGRSPVHGMSVERKIAWHRAGEIPRLGRYRPDIPPRLEAVFQRMLARSPDERYQQMAEVIAALEALRPALPDSETSVSEARVLDAALALDQQVCSTDPAVQTVDAPSDRRLAEERAGVRPRGAWSGFPRRAVFVAVVALALAALPLIAALSWIGPGALLGPRRITNSIGMQFVAIPAGSYLRGSDQDDPDAEEDEFPRHEVMLTKSFHLGRFEVTRAEYDAVMGGGKAPQAPKAVTPLELPDLDPTRLPVTDVTWLQAQEFCRRLSNLPAEVQAGRQYRLPTEAEWEYACRAGTQTAFHFGDTMTTEQANFGGMPRRIGGSAVELAPRLLPVGSHPPNAFGLYDMHGNVWEWCLDRYGSYPQRPVVNPRGALLGEQHVVRGGGWNFQAKECRSANRQAFRPDYTNQYMGFRVVCETSR